MLKIYCPHCGAEIGYEGVAPVNCTKCSKAFASAFIPQTTKIEEKPVTKAKKKVRPDFVKKTYAETETFMKPVEETPPVATAAIVSTESPDDIDEEDEGEVDENEVRAYAEHFKSIADADGVRIDFEDRVEKVQLWGWSPKK